jgi:hypothetical protein
VAEALTFVLAALAVYRLATDLAWEAGPFGWYSTLRGRVATWGRLWAEGISCPICLSFWLALPVALWLRWWQGDVLLWWLALAGVTAFLARLKA